MRFIITNFKNNKNRKDNNSNENFNTIIFYIISLALSLASIILMISAFYKVGTKAYENFENNTYNIIIDAGHGGEDGGASANGVCEKDINLEIALKLQNLFTNAGINTIMTRSEDVALSDEDIKTVRERKKSDLKNRLSIINSADNNILISIHQNKFSQEKYYGTQIFYSKNNEKSLKLAERIRTSIVDSLQPDNKRETKPADSGIYILNNTGNIAVLIECGFLSNTEEATKLKTEDYQQELALAIFKGFATFAEQEL